MSSTFPPDDPRELALGVGAGLVSLVLGFALLAVAFGGSVDRLGHPAIAGGLLGVAFAFGVAGLFEITARGVTRRGMADLTTGAGIVLSLLGPYGGSPQAFVVVGAVALLASGAYHAAYAAALVPTADDRTTEVEPEPDEAP